MSQKENLATNNTAAGAEDKPLWVSPEMLVVDLAAETHAGGFAVADQDPNRVS